MGLLVTPTEGEGQPTSRFVHFHLKVRKGNATWIKGKRRGQAAFIKKLPVPFLDFLSFTSLVRNASASTSRATANCIASTAFRKG
jgi:hypothetical protein